MALTPKQRAHLRSLAHHVKPIIYVGREGLTEATERSLVEGLAHRELIKLKVQESAPLTARDAADLLPARIPGVEHVQTIGRTVVLYRRHPDRPEIELPGA